MGHQVNVHFTDQELDEIMEYHNIDKVADVRGELRPRMKEAVMPE